MGRRRAVIVAMATIGALGLPAAAVGIPSSLTQQAPEPKPTVIRWNHFSHIHAAGTNFVLIGQVASRLHGERGALVGAHVKIYRQLVGNENWVYLATRTTSDSEFPQFRFTTEARQNAHYKVVYDGNATYGSSSSNTWLSVYRTFNGALKDGTDAATYSGHVSPYYTHKTITLQRRTCATCSYDAYRQKLTGVGGVFSFELPAPPQGRWWWRVTIPGTEAYIASYGGTLTTERVH